MRLGRCQAAGSRPGDDKAVTQFLIIKFLLAASPAQPAQPSPAQPSPAQHRPAQAEQVPVTAVRSPASHKFIEPRSAAPRLTCAGSLVARAGRSAGSYTDLGPPALCRGKVGPG